MTTYHRLVACTTSQRLVPIIRSLASSTTKTSSKRACYHASCSTHDKQPEASVAVASSDKVTSKKVDDLFQKIIYLDMIEVHLLTELINEKLGIKYSSAARASMGSSSSSDGGGKAQAQEKEKEEEQTAFDLKLTAFDAKAKLKVIKEVRSMAGLGLKEAKELVEGAPKVIKKGMKKEEAEEMKATLEKLGATIEIV